MRFARKNKRKIWYSLYKDAEPIYKLDDEGEKIVADIIDDVTYYVEEGYGEPHYTDAEFTLGTLLEGGEELVLTSYGINKGDYNCVLVLPTNSSQIDEKSLIWVDNEPTDVSEEKADYTVVKKLVTTLTTKYLLKKVVK